MLVFASHKKGPLHDVPQKLASLSGYTVTMTNFATDQIDTHIFCCHYSQAECSTSNNCHIWLLLLGQNSCKQLLVCLSFTSCHIWLLPLGQNSCKQQLLACLSPLAIFGYYILAKTAASNNCWLAFHLLPYLVTTSWSKTAASINCWLFLYFSISAIIGYITASPAPSNKLALPLFFHLCHIWLHPNQSTTK